MTKNTNSVRGGAVPRNGRTGPILPVRRHFISGSDARIIMGEDEEALLRLWREKLGEEAPAAPSDVVQLSSATKDLNRRWYELNSGYHVSDIRRHMIHRTIPWMVGTLDGLVKETGALFHAEFMLPRSSPEEAAADKHIAKLQHNMLVAGTKKSVLSIISGGGKWIELWIDADPIFQTNLVAAEKAFWRSVKTGEPPAVFDCEPPKSRIEAVRIVNIVAL
jgi:predicted phage-related endonuclease